MVGVLASSVVDRGFIGGVMVGVLASSLVDRGFKSRSCKTRL
jgi:F0F1-type ATP synthase assembly protein I